MELRLALYELARTHALDRRATAELLHLAGLAGEPPALVVRLRRGTAGLAAALVGLGVIFWIAANWDVLGRFGRFALLQGLVALACAGALWRPAARAPLALLALLATGGLFAYFGQTYQTGADPWQLFALWAVLTLPLAAVVRSELLWTPWAAVAMAAISLWVHAHTGHQWRVAPHDLPVHFFGWAAALALVAALSPAASRLTGAGPWAWRTALTLSVVMITATALGGLFHREIAPHYGLALLLLAAAAGAMALPRFFDAYALSALGLALNTLLVAGLARLLFEGGGDTAGRLLILGLAAAALLAATVSVVLRLSRRVPPAQGAAA